MQVKGLEAPGYDPRGSFGMSIAYATSDRGACHMRSFPIAVEVVEGTMPADTLDESKATFNIDFQNHYAFKFCGIWCDFWAIDYEQMGMLMKHLWKRDVTEEEMTRVGERVWNLGRLFNVREGYSKADDSVPKPGPRSRSPRASPPARSSARRDSTKSSASTTLYVAGTRTVYPPRPSSPSSASTCGSSG